MQVRSKQRLKQLFRALAEALLLTTLAMAPALASAGQKLIEGVFWQPDRATHQPAGNWEKLGADTFVVQWLVTDHKAWYPSHRFAPWDTQPDWGRIRDEPWARHIIAGLSGHYAEQAARDNLAQVTTESQQVSREPLPFKPSGYYFSVEADPSWINVCRMREALANLPRPLWISIYSHERQPKRLDLWLKSWLPADVNVFFQDGVGIGTRTPAEARQIADQLVQQFGRKRVVMVMETFRKSAIGDGFRSGYPWEIIGQLKAYRGQRIYAFDGPHYLGNWTVKALALWADNQVR